MKILILGGIKSGKSRLALKIAENFPIPRIFVATAEPFDEEMREKIRRHQAERGPSWQTLEAPLDLTEALVKADSCGVCLVDCLTVWVGNLWYHGRDISVETRRFCEALRKVETNVVIVSNEVGLGVLPGEVQSRRYVEALSELNQQVAVLCDRVYLTVAGLLIPLKP